MYFIQNMKKKTLPITLTCRQTLLTKPVIGSLKIIPMHINPIPNLIII